MGSGSVSYLITIIREREGHASIDVFFLPVLSERKKIKKTSEKKLVVKKKRFTFASAFTTKATVL